MKNQNPALQFLALLALLMMNSQISTVPAQGTAFTYQGQLNSAGAPVNGLYDFRFRLASDPLANNYVGSAYLTNGIGVTNGLFMTTVDFGAGIFTGSNYWLEVDVRTNGTGSYVSLSPLQALTPTPYAMFANTASNLSGTLPAAQLSGAVANGNLPPSPTISGTVTADSFAGNGVNVTNVNATSLNGLNATNFWQLGGNNVAPGQFIGSTNNQPVKIYVNSGEALRLEYAYDSFNASVVPNVIGGYGGNMVSNGYEGAFIGGGGFRNDVNVVGGSYASVLGGWGNTASGESSTAMGQDCVASGPQSEAMGEGCTASGQLSVAMGLACVASNFCSFAEGFNSTAGGQYSVALGLNSYAVNDYSFVWSDGALASFASTANDQFLIHAQGGVGINTSAPAGALEVASASGSPQIQVDQLNPDYARVRLSALTNSFWDIAAQSELNFFNSSYGNILTIEKNGMVGIDVGPPNFPLDVGGRMQLRQNSGGSAGLWLYQTVPADDRAFIGMENDSYVGIWGSLGGHWGLVMNVTNDNVAIGNVTPDAMLTVNGSADKPGGGSWSTYSDARLKDVGTNFTDGLSALQALQPVHYHYKSDNPLNLPSQPEYIGVVAQQVQAAIPEAVQKNPAGYLTVNNDPVIWTMLNAIKELKAENDTLKQRLDTLEKKTASASGENQHMVVESLNR